MKSSKVRIIIYLYLFTWVGGWIVASRQIKSEATAIYEKGLKVYFERVLYYEKRGSITHRLPYNPAGPTASVKWCVPLLPGILLMDSGYCIGPLWAKSGTKIVFFYGFGCIELVYLYTWFS